MLRATDCPVFEVKAKMNVSVPFDVIHQSKAQIDSDLWSFQKLEQDLMMLQKISLQKLGFTNVVFSVEILFLFLF